MAFSNPLQATRPLDRFGDGIEFCDEAEGLAAIREAGKELLVWKRSLDMRFQNWLEQLDAAHLPDFRILVRPDDCRRAMEPCFEACAMPAGDPREMLIRDVEDIVSTFAGITGTEYVDVRLERVSQDACWKFHRDFVEIRLLTTYRGAGTQWVLPVHAEEALRDQKSYEGPLERLLAHDVAIFKGSQAGEGGGIVHRSPPIAGTGRTRLLLCLNQPSAASPARWQPD